MAWLQNWTYRKKITISGSSGAGTNYQVLLKVGESSGATGYDFHLEGHSANFPSGKNQGGDIRFTADDGTTLLDFWVENVSGTSPNRVAHIWVKVSADLGTDKYIYCYYGNPNATNASNGDNTFLFFDDFDDNSIDTNKWYEENYGGADCVEQNQRMELTGTSANSWAQLVSQNTINIQNTELKVRLRNAVADRVDLYLSLTKPASGGGHIYDQPNYYRSFLEKYEGLYFRVARKVNGSGTLLYQGSYLSNDEDIKVRVAGNTIYFFEQDTQRYSETYQLSSYNCYIVFNGGFVSGTTGTDWVDELRVRKYVSPEPAFSSADAEEKLIILSDSGSGIDIIGTKENFSLADYGNGLDVITLKQLTAITISDLGLGTETGLEVKPTKLVQDLGTGQDLVFPIQAKLTLSDLGSGVDTIGILLKFLIQDSGIGRETLLIGISNLVQDSGIGIEKLGIWESIKVSDSGIGSDLICSIILNLLEEIGIGKEFIYKKITWKPSIIDDEDFSKPIIVQEYRTVVPLPLWIDKLVEAGETSDEIDVSELGSFGALIEVKSQTSVEIQIETAWGWETIDTIDFDDPNGGSQFYPFWSIQFEKVRLLFTKATTVSLQLYCRT